MPPPLIYVVTFSTGLILERLVPIQRTFLDSTVCKIAGYASLLAALFFSIPALLQFFKSKNTLITFKPANSLQTSGIYSISRNPMYVSLLLFYLCASFMYGNWWNFILIPFLVLMVQEYVIKREEKYLERCFGEQYIEYKQKVRRWL